MLTAIKEEPLMGLMVVMTSLYWSSKLPYLESNWRVFLSWDLTTFNRENWQATGNTRENQSQAKSVRQTGGARWNIITVGRRGLANRSAVKARHLRIRLVNLSLKRTSKTFPLTRRRSWFLIPPWRIRKSFHHFVLRKSTQRTPSMAGAWSKETITISTTRLKKVPAGVTAAKIAIWIPTKRIRSWGSSTMLR